MRRVGGRARVALLTMVILVGLVLPGAAASADTPLTVVADGLHSPRGLAFGPGNILYVAQAGDDGDPTSSIFVIRNSMSQHPKVRTLVDGLPSFGDEGEYVGVDGISVLGNGSNFGLYAITGLSEQIPGLDGSGAGQLLKVDRKGGTQIVADVGSADFAWTDANSGLWEENPDANPYDVLAVPGHVYVADAGANTLDEVMPNGDVKVLVWFPNEAIRDAIPTCVTQGPDGALYVGTLALEESFSAPSAKVYRVDPSQIDPLDPTNPANYGYAPWAQGLYPINGCTFGPDGNFYATELFTNVLGVFGVPGELPEGDVVMIPFNDPTTHTSLTGGALSFAGDVAVAPNGVVFATDGTAFVAPGGGRVVRLSH